MSNQHQIDWWLGLGDVLATGTDKGVEKLQRVHLAIADESFRVLDGFAVTRPWSRLVKQSHDGISRLCYGSVRVGALAASAALSSAKPTDVVDTKAPSTGQTEVI